MFTTEKPQPQDEIISEAFTNYETRSITNSCQIQRKTTWFCCKSSQLVESNSQRASSLIKEKNVSKTRCINQINHMRLKRLKPGNRYFTTKYVMIREGINIC